MASKNVPKLVLIIDGIVQQEFPLVKEITRIGRSSSDNDVIINDKLSSRVHTEITNLDGECYIRDCDSRNGTFLNEEPVQEARLHDGDEFRIGKTIFQYVDPEGTRRKETTVSIDDEDWDSPGGEGRAKKKGKVEQVAAPQKTFFTLPNILISIISVLVIVFVLYAKYALLPAKPPAQGGPINLAEAEEHAWGNYRGGDRNHPDKITIIFPPPDIQGPIELEYKGWDIDTDREVEIYLNGQFITTVEKTPDNAWSSQRRISVDPSLFNKDRDNTLVFDETSYPPTREWYAISSVRIIPAESFICEVEKGREEYKLALEKWASRSLVPSNLYEAMNRFEEAVNHAKPCPVPPDYFVDATSMLQQARDELEKQMKSLTFEIEKCQRLKDYDCMERAALQIIRMVPDPGEQYNTDAQRVLRSVENLR